MIRKKRNQEEIPTPKIEVGMHYFFSTVNQYFGFGLMNAVKMINRSLSWKTVPDQVVCRSSSMVLNR